MPPINLGSTEISKIYLGSTEVDKAYLGSTEVYSTAAATIPTTLWFNYNNQSSIAYDAATRARETSRDLSVGFGNAVSDGTTLWALSGDYLRAYTAATGRRDTSKDFDAGRTWWDVVTDGTTVWFWGWDGRGYAMRAYTFPSFTRDSGKDFYVPSSFWNRATMQRGGVVTDGTNIWICSVRNRIITANGYNISTRTQNFRDIRITEIPRDTSNFSSNLHVRSAMYNGTTLWFFLNVERQRSYTVNAYAFTASTRSADSTKNIYPQVPTGGRIQNFYACYSNYAYS